MNVDVLELDGLPGPLPRLVADAIEAEEVFERAVKTSVATEVLMKWLLAVKLRGKRIDQWPTKVRKTVQENDSSAFSPGFGTWLYMLRAAECFTHDGTTEGRFDAARLYRNRLAHYYTDFQASSGREVVGSLNWWQRLLAGSSIKDLRTGRISETTSDFAKWDDGSSVKSLEPWVVCEEGVPLLLHRIAWSQRLGSYANYVGSRRDYRLEPTFFAFRERTSGKSIVIDLPQAHALNSFLATRAEHQNALVLGPQSAGLSYLAELARKQGQQVIETGSSDDLEAVARSASVGVIVFADPSFESELREVLDSAVESLRLIRAWPPTDLDVLRLVAATAGAVPSKKQLAAIRLAIQNDANRLAKLVGLLQSLKSRGNQPIQRALDLLPQTLQEDGNERRDSKGAPPRSDLTTVFEGWNYLTLEHGADGRPKAIPDKKTLLHLAKEKWQTMATELEQGSSLASTNIWVTRWLASELSGPILAYCALLAVGSGNALEATALLRRVVPARQDSGGRYGAVASAFMAAACRSLHDYGVDIAMSIASTVCDLESLAWLVGQVDLKEAQQEELCLGICNELGRSARNGQSTQFVSILEGTNVSRYQDSFDVLDDHPLGRAAARLAKGSDYRNDFARWLEELDWVELSAAAPEGMGRPIRYEYTSSVSSLHDLLVSANEMPPKAVAKRAVGTIARCLSEGRREEARRWEDGVLRILAGLDAYWQMERLRDLARIYARHDDWDSALSCVQRMDVGRYRISGLVALVEEARDQRDLSNAYSSGVKEFEKLIEPRLQREAALKLFGALTSQPNLAPRECLQDALERVVNFGTATDAARAWHDLAMVPSPTPRSELESRLRPGMLEWQPEWQDCLEGFELASLSRSMSEDSFALPDCATETSFPALSALAGGFVIEVTLRPRELADFAGLVCVQAHPKSGIGFKLRLGGDSPRLDFDTTWGSFAVKSTYKLGALSSSQQPYTIVAAYFGTTAKIFVDGEVRAVRNDIGGKLLPDAWTLQFGQEAPGYRDFSGEILSAHIWRRDKDDEWKEVAVR